MIRVLFVCIHNSARSQMAEAFLKEIGGNGFLVESAGLEPGRLNPYVVEAMAEIGIDISQNRTKSVWDLLSRNEEFDFVITVCDEANAQRCPTFPGKGTRLHWGFPDPSAVNGSREEIMNRVREIRDQIRDKIKEWVASLNQGEGYERPVKEPSG